MYSSGITSSFSPSVSLGLTHPPGFTPPGSPLPWPRDDPWSDPPPWSNADDPARAYGAMFGLPWHDEDRVLPAPRRPSKGSRLPKHSQRAMATVGDALARFRDHRSSESALRGAIVNAMAQCGNDWETALRCLDRLGESRSPAHPGPVRPDVAVYNAAMTICAKAGQLDQVQRLLGGMMLDGLSPDDISFRVVLLAFRARGQARQALDMFDRLCEFGMALGFYPDVRTHNIVLTACARAGLGKEALRIFDRLLRLGPRYGIRPDAINYTTVIAACDMGRRADDALRIFKHMTDHGWRWKAIPDPVTYNTLISVCAKARHIEGVLLALDHLRTEGPRHGIYPDLATYNLAMEACAAAGRHEQAMALFQQLEAGAGPNPPVADLRSYAAVLPVASDTWTPRLLEMGIADGIFQPSLGLDADANELRLQQGAVLARCPQQSRTRPLPAGLSRAIFRYLLQRNDISATTRCIIGTPTGKAQRAEIEQCMRDHQDWRPCHPRGDTGGAMVFIGWPEPEDSGAG